MRAYQAPGVFERGRRGLVIMWSHDRQSYGVYGPYHGNSNRYIAVSRYAPPSKYSGFASEGAAEREMERMIELEAQSALGATEYL